jgi:hypothetical protein
VQKEVPGLGTVMIAPFAPMRGLAVKAKLGKALAPILAQLAPILKESEGQKLEELDAAKAMPMIGAVFANLDPDTLPELISDLLSTTSVVITEGTGKKQSKVKCDLCDVGEIDRVFMGRDHLLLTVIALAFKEHVAGFIGGSANDRSAPPAPTA